MNKTKRLIRIVGSLIFSVVLLASIPGVRSYALEHEDQKLLDELVAQGYDSKVAFDEIWERKGKPDVYGTGGIDGICKYGTYASSGKLSSPKHTHSWDDGVVTKEASCTEEGIKTYTCSCGKTKDEKIAKLDHTYDKVDVPATCISYRQEVYTCPCGDTYTLEFPEEGYADHTYTTTEESYDAQCTEAGMIYYVCDVCGDSYEEIIEPKGHTFTGYTIDKEPLCTEEGAKSIYCDECGEIQEGSTVVIEKTPHIEDSNHDIIPATFWKNGLETVHCVDCSEVLSETILPARGGVFRFIIPVAGVVAVSILLFFALGKRNKH